MKKLISFILLAALLVSCVAFAGCDDPKDDFVAGDNNIEAEDIFGEADDTTAAADTSEAATDSTEAVAGSDAE